MSEAAGFASHEMRVFSLLSNAGFAPSVIFDIGAANGTWSALISTVFPEASFHLFEPLATLLPAYQRDLHYQMKWHPNFTLHTVALAVPRAARS